MAASNLFGLDPLSTPQGIHFNSAHGLLTFSSPSAFPSSFLLPLPALAGVYVILAPDANWRPLPYRPIYFGETGDLSTRVNAAHEHFENWKQEAAQLYVSYMFTVLDSPAQRRQIEEALIACYAPQTPLCNRKVPSNRSALSQFARLIAANAAQPPAGSLASLARGLAIPPRTSRTLLNPPPAPRRYALFISHAWDYNDEYYRLVDMLDNAEAGFAWHNLSVPEHDPVPSRSAAQLNSALESKIASSDCVLILSGMYCSHSYWIQREIDIAKRLGKPIIGIKPRGQERIPLEVQQASSVPMVGWSSSSVVAAVRSVMMVPPPSALPRYRALPTPVTPAPLSPPIARYRPQPPSTGFALGDLMRGFSEDNRK